MAGRATRPSGWEERSADRTLLRGNNSIRYPDPAIKVNDTVKINLEDGKITDFIKFDSGVIAMVTGGRNMGRVGVITHRERHDGGFNIVHIKDAVDNEFATRESNVFVIGLEKPWISLPKGKGVKVRSVSVVSVPTVADREIAFHCRGEGSPQGLRSCWPLNIWLGERWTLEKRWSMGTCAARLLRFMYSECNKRRASTMNSKT